MRCQTLLDQLLPLGERNWYKPAIRSDSYRPSGSHHAATARRRPVIVSIVGGPSLSTQMSAPWLYLNEYTLDTGHSCLESIAAGETNLFE